MWGSRVRISSSPPKTKHTREGVLHFCLAGEIRTISCNGPVDRCPSPAGRRWLHSVSNLFKSTKNEGAVRKVCRCEPVTDVTGVAAPRLNGNRLVLLPICLKIRGIVPEGNTLGVPHQRARWFAMTERFLTAPFSLYRRQSARWLSYGAARGRGSREACLSPPCLLASNIQDGITNKSVLLAI